jgi:hypothetical protein
VKGTDLSIGPADADLTHPHGHVVLARQLGRRELDDPQLTPFRKNRHCPHAALASGEVAARVPQSGSLDVLPAPILPCGDATTTALEMVAENPFTLLTFIAAPAILTNASSVLALNTANRYGRAFDRAREVGRELERTPPEDALASFRTRLLERLTTRALLLLRAQTAFYVALGLFVLSALVSLLGAAVGIDHPQVFRPFAALGFGIGAFATVRLAQGCFYTVQETRLAMASLRDEARLLLARHGQPVAGEPRTPAVGS